MSHELGSISEVRRIVCDELHPLSLAQKFVTLKRIHFLVSIVATYFLSVRLTAHLKAGGFTGAGWNMIRIVGHSLPIPQLKV
jgi:hypothetical protein